MREIVCMRFHSLGSLQFFPFSFPCVHYMVSCVDFFVCLLVTKPVHQPLHLKTGAVDSFKRPVYLILTLMVVLKSCLHDLIKRRNEREGKKRGRLINSLTVLVPCLAGQGG